MRADPIKGTFVVFIVVAFFVFFWLLAFCTEVRGESKAPGMNTGQCMPIPTMITIVKEQFKEVVVFKGTNNREQMVLITQNPLTKTWTALNSFEGGYFCMVAFGGSGAVLPQVDYYGGNSKSKSN